MGQIFQEADYWNNRLFECVNAHLHVDLDLSSADVIGEHGLWMRRIYEPGTPLFEWSLS